MITIRVQTSAYLLPEKREEIRLAMLPVLELLSKLQLDTREELYPLTIEFVNDPQE